MARTPLTRGFTALLSGFLGASLAASGIITAAHAIDDNPVQVGVLVPVIAEATDGQYLSAVELEALTAEDGEWSILTESARKHGLTVALDTRITASIDFLGATAPSAASEWLDAVLDTDPLLLPWGNADVWALSAAGDRPFDAETIARLSDSNAADLVLWPSGSITRTVSVSQSRALGYSRVLVDSTISPNGIDTALSSAVALAVSESSTDSITAEASSLRSRLGDGTVIALSRIPTDVSASRFAALIDEWSQSGVTFAPVSPASTSSSLDTIDSGVIPDTLREAIRALDADEALVGGITNDPELLFANRLRALSALTNGLAAPQFDDAAQAFIADTGWISSSLFISLASEYTILSNSANVPLSVANNSDASVTVLVSVRATSAILQVEAPLQAVTIAPQSNVRIEIPISTVANGRTMIVATLKSESGEQIGTPVTLPVTVQAQWETLTLVLFGTFVGAILVIGAIRTIRRRRSVR